MKLRNRKPIFVVSLCAKTLDEDEIRIFKDEIEVFRDFDEAMYMYRQGIKNCIEDDPAEVREVVYHDGHHCLYTTYRLDSFTVSLQRVGPIDLKVTNLRPAVGTYNP